MQYIPSLLEPLVLHPSLYSEGDQEGKRPIRLVCRSSHLGRRVAMLTKGACNEVG